LHSSHLISNNLCIDECVECDHKAKIIWLKDRFFCRVFPSPHVQWKHFPPCPRYDPKNKDTLLNKRNKLINTFLEDSLMDRMCKLVKDKLTEYGYQIYNLSKTSNEKEFCLMTESMMIFINEEDQSLTLSFECSLEPEKVGQSIMILNEIYSVKLIYISESYIFDEDNKKYIVGDDAKKLSVMKTKNEVLRKITEEQLYCNMLLTHKCHEC